MAYKRVPEGKNNKIIIAAVAIVAVIAALIYALCGNSDAKLYKGSPVVAKINGKTVYQLEADNIVKALITSNDGKPVSYSDLDEKSKLMIIREVAAQRAILKEAKSENIKEDNDIQIKVSDYRNKLIRDKVLAKIANTEVTQDKLLAKYNEIEKTVKGKIQIKAAHILLSSESDARDAVELLKKEPFSKVAREKSVDSSNKDRGGELGYLIEGTMDPDFEKAALALKAGEVSAPIKTKFGWHIINLEERKLATIAPFEALKARIAQDLYNEALKQHAEALLKDAKIDLIAIEDKTASKGETSTEGKADESNQPEASKDENTAEEESASEKKEVKKEDKKEIKKEHKKDEKKR